MIVEVKSFPVPRGLGAITIGSIIFIKDKDDKQLIEHEQVHVNHFKNDWLFPVKYLFNTAYRYKSEIEAYKVSIKNGLDIYTAAAYLHTNYRTNKTLKQIRNDLTTEGRSSHGR